MSVVLAGLSGVQEAYDALAVGNRAELANAFLAARLPALRGGGGEGGRPSLRDLVELVLRALLQTGEDTQLTLGLELVG